MDELTELQARHMAGHGPCGCTDPGRCVSARYLAVIERLVGENDRLERDKGKLAKQLQKMAEGEHLSYAPHREYPFAKCPFILCRENRAALRAGKARR